MEGMDAVLTEAGFEHTLTGVPAMFSFVLGISSPPHEYRDLQRANMELYEHVHAAVRRRGVEYEMDGKEPLFLCEAHSEADIDATLNALADALHEVKKRM
jgi:glutamate-1-semialdehyde 2,1-aminomutase